MKPAFRILFLDFGSCLFSRVSGSFNDLLNPLHAHFRRIRNGKPKPFRFDPRLLDVEE